VIVPDEIEAPYYSYDDPRREADEFLAECHPAGTIAVPIEPIVEFKEGHLFDQDASTQKVRDRAYRLRPNKAVDRDPSNRYT
jgi:hypothetical protein